MKDILTLGIESSCDETAAAVILNGRTVLSNIISTSLELHKEYGGVVPEIASRKHVEFIMPAVDSALKEAGVSLNRIDYIGATYGPGLIGALLVGLSAAKALSWASGKPLVPVHHIEGHISANYLQYPDLEPPFICLVASGGHSHIVDVQDYGCYQILGRTRDDAAGEAYDKIARALGLGYPGGPVVDKLSLKGNAHAIEFPRVHFKDSYDFSFSGLKTSVLNYLNKSQMQGVAVNVPDVCASFQEAVVDVLSENTVKAAVNRGYGKIALAGGVASNMALRRRMEERASAVKCSFYRPSPILCTDNGAMIGAAAYYAAVKRQRFAGLDLNATANISLEEI